MVLEAQLPFGAARHTHQWEVVTVEAFRIPAHWTAVVEGRVLYDDDRRGWDRTVTATARCECGELFDGPVEAM